MSARTTRLVAAGMAVAVTSVWMASCTPPPTPDPNNIANMTDEQVEARLLDILPDVQTAVADPTVLERIPPEHRAEVRQFAADLDTPEGRDRLTEQLRHAAATTRGGFQTAKEKFAGGLFGNLLALSDGFEVDPGLHGTRSPAVPKSGANVPYESTSGNCAAPGSPGAPGQPGTVNAPASLTPNQLITPEHDVFAKYTFRLDGVTFITNLSPVGEPTINGTAGAEFRGSGASWQMRVRVDIQDVNKGFPVRALYPLFHLRPLGGTAAQETQVQAVDGNIYCYANDGPEATRGYFEGWIPIPTAEPGFQLITEVVENDFYFRFDGEDYQPLLNAPGPQFFAGADRSTVHIGQDPVTDSGSLNNAVGAFATIAPDPGNGSPNGVTETNGEPADDVEAAVSGLLASQVIGGLSDRLEGSISDTAYPALSVWGSLAERPQADVDLSFVDPTTTLPNVTDEPAGHVGAIQVTIHGEAHADAGMQFLGVPCHGLTLDVEFDTTATIWADSAGFGTGITPRSEVRTDPDVNMDMPWYNWAPPLDVACAPAFALVALFAPGTVEDGVNDKLNAALGEGGTITKLMAGLDLDDYLPTLAIDPIALGNTTTGGAVIRPHVGNLDNAWCTATGAPAGCSPDQSLIGSNGVEVVADASLTANNVTQPGFPLAGRFPNVFAPTVTTKVENLVVSHRDANGVAAGLGVVVDPRLVNLALRALAQGPALGTTTNGIADIANFELPLNGYSITIRPEVAPMVFGASSPIGPTDGPAARAVAPDLRLNLRTSDDDPRGVRFSAAATVNVGLGFDPVARSVRPILDSPIVDLQVTGGCQVDYTNGYAASYLFCGRGTGGNGGSGITSLTDLLDQIANAIVLPLIDDSLGSIGLPSLDGLVPRAHLALANVRFAQRGGNLAVYADVAPMPLVELHGSAAGYGGEDDTIRFFAVPTNIDIVNTPTTYAWEITDKVTGRPVPFSVYPGSGGVGVQFASSAFTPADQVDKRKTVVGRLTLDQAGLHVVGAGEFSWVPPSPVPPPNCPPGPVSFLQSLPGGIGGYGSIGVVVC